MTKRKHKSGLTEYMRKKMNAEDISKWITENKPKLVEQGLLVELEPQSDGVYLKSDSSKTIYYLKLELE